MAAMSAMITTIRLFGAASSNQQPKTPARNPYPQTLNLKIPTICVSETLQSKHLQSYSHKDHSQIEFKNPQLDAGAHHTVHLHVWLAAYGVKFRL